MKEKKDLQRGLRLVMLVLLVLLVLASGALALRLVLLGQEAKKGDTAIVPDNLIGEAQMPAARVGLVPLAETTVATQPQNAATVALHKGQPGDNERFNVENMLPGDQVTQYFCLKVSHSDEVEVFFTADVTDQTNKLGDVLYVRITHLETDNVIYEGPYNSMNVNGYGELFPKSETGETIAYYQIDVWLPTWVSNEHQAMNAMLEARWQWFVKDEGPLLPPAQTGDTITMILAVAVIALAAMMLLVYLRRREKEAEHGKEA